MLRVLYTLYHGLDFTFTLPKWSSGDRAIRLLYYLVVHCTAWSSFIIATQLIITQRAGRNTLAVNLIFSYSGRRFNVHFSGRRNWLFSDCGDWQRQIQVLEKGIYRVDKFNCTQFSIQYFFIPFFLIFVNFFVFAFHFYLFCKKTGHQTSIIVVIAAFDKINLIRVNYNLSL